MNTRDRAILAYNPFDGDRDSHTRLLSDKMIVARFSHDCAVCFERIARGDRIRARTEVSYDDRKVMTFRFCSLCCDAMAKVWRDGGKAICDRSEIGVRKARRRAA